MYANMVGFKDWWALLAATPGGEEDTMAQRILNAEEKICQVLKSEKEKIEAHNLIHQIGAAPGGKEIAGRKRVLWWT